MTLLMAQVEANPCQTIEYLTNNLNQPSSTIQELFQQIGKTIRAGVWVPYSLSEENRANRSTTCNLLLQRLGQRKQVCIQRSPSHEGVPGNKAADELAGRGGDLPNPSSTVLTHTEIHSF
ncbi:histone-lysine N-methyltransferase SETMAR [Trichonephila clavipes]|nr:histone-lysine N-methyltransferase SETMAR [Trichonephila clavipes]